MDTLTHALSGALVGRILAPTKGEHTVSARECVALGFCAAAFPDTDVVLSWVSPLAYLLNHRGVTHSLLMLPVWSALLAWIWSRIRRRQAHWRTYLAVSAAAIFIHILGDLITSFGTMIFAPFSDARVAWSTTFIIDLWFSGILIAGLLASALLPRSRLPAMAALAVLCGYVGLQWMAQREAVAVGEAFARERGIAAVEVSAIPRPVSPFNWMVVVSEADRYHFAHVNVRRTEPVVAAEDAGFIRRLDAVYEPVAAARWHALPRFGERPELAALGEEAWRQAPFGFFRWFAQFPLVSSVEQGNPSTCVWFRDLRFFTPGRNAWPFEFGMCRQGGAGQWRAFQRDEGRRIELFR